MILRPLRHLFFQTLGIRLNFSQIFLHLAVSRDTASVIYETQLQRVFLQEYAIAYYKLLLHHQLHLIKLQQSFHRRNGINIQRL